MFSELALTQFVDREEDHDKQSSPNTFTGQQPEAESPHTDENDSKVMAIIDLEDETLNLTISTLPMFASLLFCFVAFLFLFPTYMHFRELHLIIKQKYICLFREFLI